jgi:PAS domain S-box-containing protein
MDGWYVSGAPAHREVDTAPPDAAMQLRALRAPDGRLVDFQCVYANAATEHWVGPGQGLIGRTLREVAPWTHACGLVAFCARALERRVPDQERFVRPTPEGPRAFLARVAPEGEGLSLFVEDLAARVASEEVLRRDRDLLHAVIEATTDAVYVKDLAGRYVLVNPAAARAFGREPEALLGRTDTELVGPTMAAPTEAHDKAVRESGSIATYEDAEGGPGFGCIWQTIKGVLRRPDGTVYALFGISRDVTARRRQEQEREAEGRFRERFIGVLGHDLGNPLAAIRLSTAALLVRDNVPPDTQRVLHRIEGSAERMARMVKQLLDFTRARMAGGIPLRPRDTSLEDVARRIIGELELVHASRTVRLEVSGECRGHWDDERLGQVLSNLVGNALQNSPEGTPVSVRLESRGAQQRLEVHNAGAPLPESLRAHLFEPFHRTEGPQRRSRAGLGLGLYIVSQIVQAHGGQVEVHSTLEEGTCFTVTLPRGERPPVGGSGPGEPAQRAG